MDVNRLNTGEKLAGASGIALLLLMSLLDWFNVDVGGGFADIDTGVNAWTAFSFIDIVLFLTALAAIALAVIAATRTSVNLPVALSAVVAGLGILSVLLILFRIISPPDGGAGDFGIDVGRSIGVFLGLIAASGVAAGGWLAMQEEGATFTDRPTGGTAPPPPPPPPAPPTQ